MYVTYPTDCGPIADLANHLEHHMPEVPLDARLLMAEEIIRTIQQSLPEPGVIVPAAAAIVQRTIAKYLQIPEVASYCQFENDIQRVNAAQNLATRLRDGLLTYENDIRQRTEVIASAKH